MLGGLGHLPQENLKFRCLEMLFSTHSSQYLKDLFIVLSFVSGESRRPKFGQ